MDPLINSHTGSLCFRFMDEEELETFTRDHKFLQTASDFGEVGPQPAEKKEKLFVVPNQFPFIFRILDSVFARSSIEPIQKTLKKLNTLRRIQITRSLVSRRIIYSNMQACQGQIRYTGRIKINQSDPLSGNVLMVTENRLNFGNIDVEEGFSAVVDFEKPQGAETKPTHKLRASLSHFQFEVELMNRCRSQKGLLYYRALRKVKKSDLFYCFINISSSLMLKLYFSPHADEPGGKSFLLLSAIQVLSLDRSLAPCRLRNPGFSETVGRAKQYGLRGSNYRFNVATEGPGSSNKRLLGALDFLGKHRKNETDSSSSGHKSFKSFQFRKKPAAKGFSSPVQPKPRGDGPGEYPSSSQAPRGVVQRKVELSRSHRPLHFFDSKFTRHRSPEASSKIERKSKNRSEDPALIGRNVPNSSYGWISVVARLRINSTKQGFPVDKRLDCQVRSLQKTKVRSRNPALQPIDMTRGSQDQLIRAAVGFELFQQSKNNYKLESENFVEGFEA